MNYLKKTCEEVLLDSNIIVERSTIENCKMIDLQLIRSERKGAIIPVYNGIHVPFNIRRVYYLYDIPAGANRGEHAHKNLQQLIVAVSGSFNVTLDDGKNKKVFPLNQPSRGLYVPPMMWRSLENFSGGAVCLVLASLQYDENDYIRNYKDFLNVKW